MSKPSTPAPSGGGRQEKTMSSRLMNLKFMQRAAASTSPATKPSPSSTATATATATYELLDNEKPAKRRRTGDHPTVPSSTPGTPQQQSIPPTPKSATEQADYVGQRGETQWVLHISSTGPNGISTNGQASEEDDDYDDDEEDEQEDSVLLGRRTYGNFKRKKTGTTTSKPEDGEDGSEAAASEDDEEEEDDENEDGEVDEDEEEDFHRKAREENVREKRSLDKLKLWKGMSSISGSGGGVSKDRGGRGNMKTGAGFGGKETGRDYGKAFGKKKRKRDR